MLTAKPHPFFSEGLSLPPLGVRVVLRCCLWTQLAFTIAGQAFTIERQAVTIQDQMKVAGPAPYVIPSDESRSQHQTTFETVRHKTLKRRRFRASGCTIFVCHTQRGSVMVQRDNGVLAQFGPKMA